MCPAQRIHYDVQPPELLDLWETPPFEPTVRAGALYARGAKDDKGELVARIAAIDAVREANGGSLPCGLTFVVEGEEEGGIDPEGHPTTLLGVRGVVAVEIGVQTLKADAHSGQAHKLPNAAWRLLRLIASLKDGDETIRIPGFYETRDRRPR